MTPDVTQCSAPVATSCVRVVEHRGTRVSACDMQGAVLGPQLGSERAKPTQCVSFPGCATGHEAGPRLWRTDPSFVYPWEGLPSPCDGEMGLRCASNFRRRVQECPCLVWAAAGLTACDLRPAVARGCGHPSVLPCTQGSQSGHVSRRRTWAHLGATEKPLGSGCSTDVTWEARHLPGLSSGAGVGRHVDVHFCC